MRGTLRVSRGDGPLRVEHDRLVRDALVRGAPISRDESRSLADGHDPAVVAAAIRTWRGRMLHEHLSAAVFSRLLPQLIEAEAAVDVKMCVLRMAMDELHHSMLCAEVVRGLGGEPAAPAELATEPLPAHDGVSPRERALRNVLFVGCLSETVALAMLSEEHELATEPFVKRVLAQLVADELTHAKLGWSYVAETWPTLDAAARTRTAAYLPVALAHLATKWAELIRAAGTSSLELDAGLRALGITPARDAHELFDATLRTAILPRFAEMGLAPSTPAGATLAELTARRTE